MTNPSQSELDQINADRARMFTRAFWKSLLQGREGLGDTFWAGNYLAGLLFLPIVIVLLFVPALYGGIAPAFVMFGLYLMAVARAVWLAKPKGNSGMELKVTAVVWTLLNALCVMAVSPFSAGQ
ncbi:hypothetical protein [Pacificibacter marinus]|uniref:DUF805 domain-containing protein n=1 Tax=Pacificibacter marinus TaxID=658057 RepID=A0A1Y5SSR8_9RHOB|nr:hypothetical protein [Pacificibacter marinus]SEK69235.1 hypothetical protein SAMN04488032_105127 [Pacificibacter marinus]SLN45645.1 hypothetical protein PAM7971_02198 [Pacificibacter marinus]